MRPQDVRKRRLKRSLAKAHRDLDNALANIQDLHQEFDGVHPEYAEMLELMSMGLVQIQGTMEEFWASAWGSQLTNWAGYIT